MRLKTTAIFCFFFVLLTLYFFFAFDCSLYFHSHQALFLFDPVFFRDFTLYPGGLGDWAFQFLMQFMNFNLSGSLLGSALFISIFMLVHTILKRTGAFRQPLVLAFLPVALLLGLQNQYRFPLVISFKTILVLAFFSAYIRCNRGCRAAMIVLSGPIYYMLGGWFFLLYVLLCALYGVLFPRPGGGWIYAGACLLAGLACPAIAARTLFLITLREAYFYSVPYEWYFEPDLFRPALAYTLYILSFPALLGVCFVWLRFSVPKAAARQKILRISGHWLTQAAVVILAGGLTLKASANLQEKQKIRIDRLAGEKRWQELLTLSRQIRGYDRLVNFQTNRALYHTGQLLENLFTVDQSLGTDGLFIDRIVGSQIAMPASDLYFDLGYINASQVMAFEAETKFRYDPRVVKRLFMTHLINGNPAAARKYLNLMDRSLWNGGWVRQNQGLLHEPAAAADPLIRLKREQSPKNDFFINRQSPGFGLIRLFTENPNNRMAFEYLMAYYLLERRIGNLIEYLGQFRKMGYDPLPIPVEEAVLLFNTVSRSKAELKETAIRPRTIERFLRFNTILASHRNRPSEAREMLKAEFRDTYWYYVRYVSPSVTAQKITKSKIHEEFY